MRDAAVAFIVYDVTKRESFASVGKWIDDARSHHQDGVVIAVLGNKVDLGDRGVKEEEGCQLAKEKEVLFKEVSAKVGTNIKEFFKEIAVLLISQAECGSSNSGHRSK